MTRLFIVCFVFVVLILGVRWANAEEDTYYLTCGDKVYEVPKRTDGKYTCPATIASAQTPMPPIGPSPQPIRVNVRVTNQVILPTPQPTPRAIAQAQAGSVIRSEPNACSFLPAGSPCGDGLTFSVGAFVPASIAGRPPHILAPNTGSGGLLGR